MLEKFISQKHGGQEVKIGDGEIVSRVRCQSRITFWVFKFPKMLDRIDFQIF